MDFKGYFSTGDGTRCDPFTITDAHSRYLIRCQTVSRMDLSQVVAVCEAAMREYGMPARIRTENGAPFAGTGLLGLSKLSLSWTKMGTDRCHKKRRRQCLFAQSTHAKLRARDVGIEHVRSGSNSCLSFRGAICCLVVVMGTPTMCMRLRWMGCAIERNSIGHLARTKYLRRNRCVFN